MELFRLWMIDEAGHRARAYAVESEDMREVWAYARTLLSDCTAVEVWKGPDLLDTVRPSTLH